jgi:hypothetical protein
LPQSIIFRAMIVTSLCSGASRIGTHDRLSSALPGVPGRRGRG